MKKEKSIKMTRNAAGVKCWHYEITSNPTHWHDFYELELVTSGTGIHRINGINYEWKKGEIHFLRPTDFHEIILDENTKSSVHLVQLSCSSLTDDIRKVLSSTNQPFQTYLTGKEFEYADTLCQMLHDYVPINTKNDISNHIISLLTLLFFQNLPFKPRENKKQELIGKIIVYISENFRNEITLEQIANNFYISKNYLCMYFKRHMNMTVTNYIKETRLDYAAKLATETDITSTEICNHCGYGSISNFLRDFKNKYNMSPLQMRKTQNL